MRSVRIAPEAEVALAGQLEHLIARGAAGPAQALKTRVQVFLSATLADYPRTGRFLVERNLWESWIPETRLVVWYTFTDDELTAISFWHTSQDRRRR